MSLWQWQEIQELLSKREIGGVMIVETTELNHEISAVGKQLTDIRGSL